MIDGPTVTRLLREQELCPYTYIVMLTGRTDADDLISAFSAGSDEAMYRVKKNGRNQYVCADQLEVS